MTDWTEWAYDTGQAVPAEMVSTNPADITPLIQRDFGIQINPNALTTAVIEDLNAWNTYPVERTNTQSPNFWSTQEPPIITYEAAQGGMVYQAEGVWRDMTVAEAQPLAYDAVVSWANQYGSSYFQSSINTFWYKSNVEAQANITRKKEKARADTKIFTWDGVLTIAPDFGDFFDDLDDHMTFTEDTADAFNDDIESANVLQEIIDVINALLPVPVPTPTPGAPG